MNKKTKRKNSNWEMIKFMLQSIAILIVMLLFSGADSIVDIILS